jgi:hypothetical protein
MKAVVVLCVETDDYCPPEARVLPSGRPFRLSGFAYGQVREGVVYAVWADRGTVIAELLDQDHPGAATWRKRLGLPTPGARSRKDTRC